MGNDILINGSINGAFYALLALGFCLMFGVARLVNLYHGSYYMLAAYFTYLFAVLLRLPLLLAVAASLSGVVAVAILVDRVCVNRVRQSSIAVMICTLGLAYFTQYLVRILFGPRYLSIPAFVSGNAGILGVVIPSTRLLAFGVGIVLILALWAFIGKTRAGRSIMAVAQDPEAATYMGINTSAAFTMATGISAFLAGVAGIVVAPFLSVDPGMWLLPLIKAFAIVILGGLGSLWGSVLAAFLLGYIETGVSLTLSTNVREIVFLAVVLLVLIIKPSGLLGKSLTA